MEEIKEKIVKFIKFNFSKDFDTLHWWMFTDEEKAEILAEINLEMEKDYRANMLFDEMRDNEI